GSSDPSESTASTPSPWSALSADSVDASPSAIAAIESNNATSSPPLSVIAATALSRWPSLASGSRTIRKRAIYLPLFRRQADRQRPCRGAGLARERVLGYAIGSLH